MQTTGIRKSGALKLFAVLTGACASLLSATLPSVANPQLVVDVSSLKVYEQRKSTRNGIRLADQADDGVYHLPGR